ncbi:hypothetical protein AVEN_162351-1 [Araneus ventricosus]|uniref:Uncharacterized protein n=1 Tax=Araneus ventricosus TaxID=182803 RepID=A0A4Y2N4V8_ARAVE|nr:hypothetical protein AVEN_162351-1 [Araneus ventricosus]
MDSSKHFTVADSSQNGNLHDYSEVEKNNTSLLKVDLATIKGKVISKKRDVKECSSIKNNLAPHRKKDIISMKRSIVEESGSIKKISAPHVNDAISMKRSLFEDEKESGLVPATSEITSEPQLKRNVLSFKCKECCFNSLIMSHDCEIPLEFKYETPDKIIIFKPVE